MSHGDLEALWTQMFPGRKWYHDYLRDQWTSRHSDGKRDEWNQISRPCEKDLTKYTQEDDDVMEALYQKLVDAARAVGATIADNGTDVGQTFCTCSKCQIWKKSKAGAASVAASNVPSTPASSTAAPLVPPPGIVQRTLRPSPLATTSNSAEVSVTEHQPADPNTPAPQQTFGNWPSHAPGMRSNPRVPQATSAFAAPDPVSNDQAPRGNSTFPTFAEVFGQGVTAPDRAPRGNTSSRGNKSNTGNASFASAANARRQATATAAKLSRNNAFPPAEAEDDDEDDYPRGVGGYDNPFDRVPASNMAAAPATEDAATHVDGRKRRKKSKDDDAYDPGTGSTSMQGVRPTGTATTADPVRKSSRPPASLIKAVGASEARRLHAMDGSKSTPYAKTAAAARLKNRKRSNVGPKPAASTSTLAEAEDYLRLQMLHHRELVFEPTRVRVMPEVTELDPSPYMNEHTTMFGNGGQVMEVFLGGHFSLAMICNQASCKGCGGTGKSAASNSMKLPFVHERQCLRNKDSGVLVFAPEDAADYAPAQAGQKVRKEEVWFNMRTKEMPKWIKVMCAVCEQASCAWCLLRQAGGMRR